MTQVLLGSDFRKITGSQLVTPGGGVVTGFIVNSHSSGTIKFWDALTATGKVMIDTFTFADNAEVASGSGPIKFPSPLTFHTGLFVTIGGDADVTVVFNKN